MLIVVSNQRSHSNQAKNHAIAIQPLDARIRRDAYIKVNYPFILGSTIAGVIVKIGENVTTLTIGDRVVSDTPLYSKRETKYGGWQKFVVGKEGLSSKVIRTPKLAL